MQIIANYGLHSLRNIRKCLFLEEVKPLCNIFINNQFNYDLWFRCFAKKKKKQTKKQKAIFKDMKNSPEITKSVYNRHKKYHELPRKNSISTVDA